MSSEVERDRATALVLLMGILAMIGWVLMESGGNLPSVPDEERSGSRKPATPDVTFLGGLFGSTTRVLDGTSGGVLFDTDHFQPPPPAPPSRRKVDFVYRGYLQAGDDPPMGYVQVDNDLVTQPAGALLVTNLYIAEISAETLVLTNSVGETNLLEFNKKKTLEIPVP